MLAVLHASALATKKRFRMGGTHACVLFLGGGRCWWSAGVQRKDPGCSSSIRAPKHAPWVLAVQIVCWVEDTKAAPHNLPGISDIFGGRVVRLCLTAPVLGEFRKKYGCQLRVLGWWSRSVVLPISYNSEDALQTLSVVL